MDDQIGVVASTAPCHLLSLPPELRNRVYEYALYSRRLQFVFTSPPKEPPSPFRELGKQPALLQTNRQIRQESWAIFYHIHEFWVVPGRYQDTVWPSDLGHMKNATALPRVLAISIPESEYQVCTRIPRDLASSSIYLLQNRRSNTWLDCACGDEAVCDFCSIWNDFCCEGEDEERACCPWMYFSDLEERIRSLVSSEYALTADLLCEIIEEVIWFAKDCPRALWEDLEDWCPPRAPFV